MKTVKAKLGVALAAATLLTISQTGSATSVAVEAPIVCSEMCEDGEQLTSQLLDIPRSNIVTSQTEEDDHAVEMLEDGEQLTSQSVCEPCSSIGPVVPKPVSPS